MTVGELKALMAEWPDDAQVVTECESSHAIIHAHTVEEVRLRMWMNTPFVMLYNGVDQVRDVVPVEDDAE
jgi:hypothetical protein